MKASSSHQDFLFVGMEQGGEYLIVLDGLFVALEIEAGQTPCTLSGSQNILSEEVGESSLLDTNIYSWQLGHTWWYSRAAAFFFKYRGLFPIEL